MATIIKRSFIAGIALTAVGGFSQAQADDHRMWREQVSKPETQQVTLPRRVGELRSSGDHLLWRYQVPSRKRPVYVARSGGAMSDHSPWRGQVKRASRHSRHAIAASNKPR